jgi:hypothetical protein
MTPPVRLTTHVLRRIDFVLEPTIRPDLHLDYSATCCAYCCESQKFPTRHLEHQTQ